MDLDDDLDDDDHQWLITSHKETHGHIICLLMKRCITCDLAERIKPQSGQASGFRCQYAENTEDRGIC